MEQSDKLRGLWHRDTGIQPEHRIAIEARLDRVLKSWEGTRYLSGSAMKQRGADCIGFVSAVVDELYRREFKVIDQQHRGLMGTSHQSQKFVDFFKKCRSLWPAQDSQTVDCGDLILSRPANGNAHLYITGATPYSAWHCLHDFEVCASGFGSFNDTSELTFFKLLNKESWI